MRASAILLAAFAAAALLAWVPIAEPAPSAPVPAGPPERGYVTDLTCRRCHSGLFASYQQVGMARSFADAARAERIEDYGAEAYFHEPSGRYYRMSLGADGRPRFRRWQLDDAGREILVFERQVDWILGSGHTSRSYLIQEPRGEMVMLPLAWYTQEGRWAMAPGFNRADHPGLSRGVQRECMFCHNAYPPEVPPGSDLRNAPDVFPTRLPSGIGCQRCHGPGGPHVEAAISGSAPETLRSAILDPARLEGSRRHEVCYQCHLQPSVAMMPLRRFDRGAYSYTPDQPLDDYIVYFDPVEEERRQDERFEINHHPYRLEQSPCFIESAGALGCTSCHDPHRKVPVTERPAHYRAVCLSCHQVDACHLDEMTASGTADPAWAAIDPGDCVSCHMPRRRTQDVVHVVMTDHRIQRRPGGAELLAPREELVPTLVGIEFWNPHRAPGGGEGPLADAYQALAVLAAGGGANALEHLERSLARLDGITPDQARELARAFLGGGRLDDADALLAKLLAVDPDDALLLGWRGTVRQLSGDLAAAISWYERARAVDPDAPNILFNLGRTLTLDGRAAEGEVHLRRATEVMPVMAAAWRGLGQALRAQGRDAEAIAPLWRALAIDPGLTTAYLELGEALVATGDLAEARRVLRHGARWATEPAAVAASLAALPATHSPPRP